MRAVAGWRCSETVTPDRCVAVQSLLDISVEVGLQALAPDENGLRDQLSTKAGEGFKSSLKSDEPASFGSYDDPCPQNANKMTTRLL